MGVGNSTKTTAQFTVVKLGDPDYNPFIVAVLKAVLFNRDIVNELLIAAIKNIAIHMRKAVKYGEEEYLYGLPLGQILDYSGSYTDADVISAIKADNPTLADVALTRYRIINLTIIHVLLPSLITERGYTPGAFDETTGTISIHPSEAEFDNSLEEFEDVHLFSSYTSHHEILPHEFKFTLIEHELCEDLETVRIKYEITQAVEYAFWYDDDPDSGTGNGHYEYSTGYAPIGFWYDTMPIPAEFVNLTWNDKYFFAEYQEIDSGGAVLPDMSIWLYQVSSNSHPELSPIATTQTDKFLPVVPLVLKDVDQTSDDQKETDQYIQSTELLKKINMNFAAIGSVLRGDGQDVPWDNSENKSKVKDWFYLFFGLDIKEDRPEIAEYFFNFFSGLSQNGHSLNYSFRYSFINSLRLEYSIGSILSEITIGNIGGVGTFKYRKGSYSTFHTRREYCEESGDNVLVTVEDVHSSYIVEKQITPYTIRTITVRGLHMYNQVYGSHGVGTDFPGENFYFPIQFNLAQAIAFRARGKIYTGGTTIWINTVVKTKTKWYEKGFFKFVLLVIVIIIAIYTQQWWLVPLVTAMGAGVVAFLVFVVKFIAVAFIISKVASWLVRKIGGTFALILSIAIAVIAMAMGYFDVSLQLLSNYIVITAQTMLQFCSALLSALNEMLIEEAQKVVDEYLDFREELDDRWEELKTAQDLLGNSFDINPLEYSAPARYQMYPGETPDVFYYRTIQLADNTYSVVHDQISTQFDRVLRHDKDVPGYLYNQNLRG